MYFWEMQEATLTPEIIPLSPQMIQSFGILGKILKMKSFHKIIFQFSSSFHEMALYDLKSAIDHVLMVTGEEKLFYIGHSMGTVMFWIAMSHYPEYNAKIRLMTALAPVAFVGHIKSPVRLLAPFATEAEVCKKLIFCKKLCKNCSYFISL